MYPGRMRAIDEAVNELKQNNPLGGIDPNALAKNDVMMLALISNTLLYSIDCFATTNCNRARMTPRINAMGVSIQRAPNAKAVVNEIQDGNTSDTDGCQSVHEYHDPETIQRWLFHNLLEVFGCVLNSYNIVDHALFCQNC